MWIRRKEKRELQHKLWRERTTRVGFEELSERLGQELDERIEREKKLREAFKRADEEYRKLKQENEMLRMELNLLKLGR